MTWFRVDDTAHDHPKLKALTDRGFRWWFIGLSYASRYLTNGRLPKVFWQDVPKQVRAELSDGRLWDWVDPDFQIHDYDQHQSLKEDVEADKQRNREKSKAYRDKKKAERHAAAMASVTGDVTGNASPDRHGDVTDPENREHLTPNTEQSKQAAAPLIKNQLYVEKRLKYCAFVGSRIEVPKDLHAELRTSLGGVDPEKALQQWYLELDEQAEFGMWRVPVDNGIYKWLKGHYAIKFPVSVNGSKRDDTALIARLQAIERGEIKR